MSEEVKLKPCPYCGSAPRIEHHFSKDEYRYCCCSNPSCPSNLPSLTDEAAYENWNTRPIEDELRAKLAELKNAADELAFAVWSNACPKPVLDLAEKLAEVLNELEGV